MKSFRLEYEITKHKLSVLKYSCLIFLRSSKGNRNYNINIERKFCEFVQKQNWNFYITNLLFFPFVRALSIGCFIVVSSVLER